MITDPNLIPASLSYLAERNLPVGRLDSRETAKVIGYELHDIPILIAAGLLKPLGNPAPNAHKWFSAIEMVQIGLNPTFLDKANKKISAHWIAKKNSMKSERATKN